MPPLLPEIFRLSNAVWALALLPGLLAGAPSSLRFPVYFEPDGAAYIVRGLKTGARLERGGTLRLSLPGARSFSLGFAGANGRTQGNVENPLPGRTHYFAGRDSRRWCTNVPHYGRVRYRGVYPGIDVVYYGKPGGLEYDLVVAPGADPRRIRLAVSGANNLAIDGGDLAIEAGGRTLRYARPRVYQDTAGGQTEVAARYAIAGGDVRIELGGYDTGKPLVIDPAIVYSTLSGGDDEDDIQGLAVDAQGSVYLTGSAGSNNFPGSSTNTKTRTKYFPDAYVTKLDAAGSTIAFTAFFGSANGDDRGTGVALDPAGNIYVTGSTTSADFPVTTNAAQSKLKLTDAFLVKLDATGSRLLYATLLGGSNHEYPQSLAVTAAGDAVVAGYTYSQDFPKLSPVSSPASGTSKAFVFRVDTVSGQMVYSSPFGGSKSDQAFGVALDAAGIAYITGTTTSPDFPVTSNAFQTTFKGNVNTFVAKLNPAGNAFVYATLLGGAGAGVSATTNVGNAIAVDAAGCAYVVGTTDVADFPATTSLMPKRANTAKDAFLAKLNSNGSALVYSSPIGGSGFDYGFGVAVAPSGEAWVTGTSETTGTPDFPTVNPTQRAWGGGFSDWFLCRVNAAGTALNFSTFIGGLGDDGGLESPRRGGVALDQAGNVYVAGHTTSADFPTMSGAFQVRYGGYATAVSNAGDGFLVKIDPSREPAPSAVTAEDHAITTIAGGGTVGSATSGPAIDAAIGQIDAMALDRSGAVIFSSHGCGGSTITPGGTVIPGICSAGPIRSVAPDGRLRVVAGASSGILGSGDGGPAVNAALDIAGGLTTDSYGNIYIAESDSFFGNRVWKIGTDGMIHRIAGTGSHGSAGDGGPARDAELGAPRGLAVDKLGNLYIADSGTSRVRKVTPDGAITTIAGGGTRSFPAAEGGQATQAALGRPAALAVDDAGDLFIAEDVYLRKVTSSGVITTLAGAQTYRIPNFNGDARPAASAALNFPKGLAISSDGQIYIADTGNNRIRRIDRDGTIWNVAGALGAGSSGDDGPGALAQLDGPLAISFGQSGDLYIAEAHRIRKLAMPRPLPKFDAAGTVNAASGHAGAIARGAIFSIYGTGIGPATGLAASLYPLGALLGDVRIQVTQGETSKSAVPIYVSAGQINAIMPSDAPLGDVQLRVLYAGFPSAPVAVKVAPTSFQFFLMDDRETGVFQAVVSPTDYPLCTRSAPARPGQIIVGWGTGLGAGLGSDNMSPEGIGLPVDVQVLVGGKAAPVLYKGRAPTFAGVDNIYFTIPADAPTGCRVPIQVRAGGLDSEPVMIPVGTEGACR